MPGTFQNFIPPSGQFGKFPISRIKQNYYAYGFGNVVARWNAGYGTDTKTNGANIATWKDMILGRNLTSGATVPTYVSSNASLNNLPSVKFTGAARMAFDQTLPIPLNFTVWAVYVLNTISTTHNGFLSNISGANNADFYLAVTASVGERLTDAAGTSISPSANSTAKHITIWTRNNIRRDGASVGTGTLASVQGINTLGMGSANRNLLADIAEFGVISNELSTAQMDALYNNILATYP